MPDDGSACPDDYRTCYRCRHWMTVFVVPLGAEDYRAMCLHPEAPKGPKARMTPHYHGCDQWKWRPNSKPWPGAVA